MDEPISLSEPELTYHETEKVCGFYRAAGNGDRSSEYTTIN
jgi:hypothetical protein